MSGARTRRWGGARFRRLVDAWRADRQERTPMGHGRRVASIEADLGGDMTPGREARWERLDLAHPDQPDYEDTGKETAERESTEMGQRPDLQFDPFTETLEQWRERLEQPESDEPTAQPQQLDEDEERAIEDEEPEL